MIKICKAKTEDSYTVAELFHKMWSSSGINDLQWELQ